MTAAMRLACATLSCGLIALTAGQDAGSTRDRGEQPELALPRIPPKEPAEAIDTFQVLDGFRLDLLAAEPLVTGPVAMEYDENGLAYVVEMIDYPYTDKSTDQPFVERTTDLPIGRVRVLEDLDGDGAFDRGTVFAEELSWPTGLAFWQGGVFVAATPDIWYLKDTDGDRRADVRKRIYTGFRKFNVQAVMNNLRWGLDHWIYGAGSSNGGTIAHAEGKIPMPVVLGRNDFRFSARSEAFELESGGARFGNAFDDWGNRFLSNIRNPVQHVLLPHAHLARNPYLLVRSAVHDAAEAGDTLPVYRASPTEPWRAARARRWAVEAGQQYPRSETVPDGYFTSACGITIYRGTAYPPAYYGNAFVAEVAGNLIHRETLQPDGVTFLARRADEKTEFVRSTDNWFRPVNFVNAPDGTLHVLDMYREVIEHPWSIPDDIKAQLDLESGRDRGRIYRLTPPGFRPGDPPRLGDASTGELVAQLENGNSWWRDTAHRLLYERKDPAAVPLLRKLLRHGLVELGRLHALWSLEGPGALEDGDLLGALADPCAGVREHAVRLAEPRLGRSADLVDRVLALAEDPAVRVRFQVAFSLAEAPPEQAVVGLARIAGRDAHDEWMRTAIVSSALGSAGPLLSELARDGAFIETDGAPALLRQLAVVIGAQQRPAEIAAALAVVSEGGPARRHDLRYEVVVGLGEGLKRSGKSLSPDMTGEAGARLVAEVLEEAAETARDQSAPVPSRRRAAELLGYAEFSRARAVLAPLADLSHPQAVQAAAIRALAGFRDPAVSELLLGAYTRSSAALRGEILEALLARPERIPALLGAIESGSIPPAQVPPARRNLLLQHANDTIRDRARALFAADAVTPRQQVFTEYRAALALAGSRERGQAVYQRECRSCHRVGQQGSEVGPNLETIRNRTADEVLMHIIDPNREVSPPYIQYIVALRDGRVTTGIIPNETATGITLRRADAAEETILRHEIEEVLSTGQSLMPEGIEEKISLEEMADLLAFLLQAAR